MCATVFSVLISLSSLIPWFLPFIASHLGVVEGELRHILTLFFNLSKYKQNLKTTPPGFGLKDSGKPLIAPSHPPKSVANPYVSEPPNALAPSIARLAVGPANSMNSAPPIVSGLSSRRDYTVPSPGRSPCQELRLHPAERRCSDSGLGASVTNLSPSSPITTTNSVTDANSKLVHTR